MMQAHVEGIEANDPALHPADMPAARESPQRKSSPLGIDLDPGADFDPGDLSSRTKTGVIVLPQGMRAVIMFVLLLALMLTGMPVSIALGLTVLTFMFTLTDVPTEVGGAEAVHRPGKLRDHGDPVLHPGRQFPDPWRRRAAHDQLSRPSMVGHWYGGLGLAGVVACALFARCPARRRRPWSPSARSCCRRWWRKASRSASAPASSRRRLARHPDSAVDPDDALRGRHEYLDRQVVHRRLRPRHRCWRPCWARSPGISRRRRNYPRMEKATFARAPGTHSAKASGA